MLCITKWALSSVYSLESILFISNIIESIILFVKSRCTRQQKIPHLANFILDTTSGGHYRYVLLVSQMD